MEEKKELGKKDTIKYPQEATLSAYKEYGQILCLKLKKDEEKQNNKVKTFNAIENDGQYKDNGKKNERRKVIEEELATEQTITDSDYTTINNRITMTIKDKKSDEKDCNDKRKDGRK